jgi:hypothetical protein
LTQPLILCNLRYTGAPGKAPQQGRRTNRDGRSGKSKSCHTLPLGAITEMIGGGSG